MQVQVHCLALGGADLTSTAGKNDLGGYCCGGGI